MFKSLFAAFFLFSCISLGASMPASAFDQSLSNRLVKEATTARCRGKQCSMGIIDKITVQLRGKPDYRPVVSSLRKVKKQIAAFCSRGCSPREEASERAKLQKRVFAEREKIMQKRRQELKAFAAVYPALLAKLG